MTGGVRGVAGNIKATCNLASPIGWIKMAFVKNMLYNMFLLHPL